MKNSVKVLECIRQGQIGGGESHLLSLVENLDRKQFDPVVLSFTTGPMIDRLSELHVPSKVIHTTRPFDISKWGTVKAWIKEQGIQLVHAHGTRACSNVIWAAKKLNIPVIYTVHGWSFHDDQQALVRRIRIMGEKYLTSRSAMNISVSASNRASGVKVIPGFQSQVISNGINRTKFDPDGAYKNIRAELNIPADVLLVLFVARFTAHKQPITLIRAFQQALKVKPDMHLLMIGEGDQRPEASALIEQEGLQASVTLHNFRQDVPAVLAAADVFVLPSLWEGLPIGLLEAMAMGKPVIATRVDGTIEVVTDGENGLLVEAGNAGQLAEALVRLGQDRGRRDVFAAKARETVKEQFDAANMTRQIEDVYCRVLNFN
jgi:glycosyltransferase involved in cell wall biosynthesis